MADAWYEKILDGVKAVAPTVANLVMPGSGLLLDKLMRDVSGEPDAPIEEVAAKIAQDPALQAELLKIASDKEVKLAEIARDTKRIEADVVIAEGASTSAQLETVAQTMRVEATQAGWAGKWRPFWGFVSAVAFGISVLGIIGWVAYALITRQLELLKVVPELIFALTTLFSVPGAILGVASWHRGVEKRILAEKTA